MTFLIGVRHPTPSLRHPVEKKKAYGQSVIFPGRSQCFLFPLFWVAAWLSGSALVSINEVTLHRARLALGWVTVCGRVNHLGL